MFTTLTTTAHVHFIMVFDQPDICPSHSNNNQPQFGNGSHIPTGNGITSKHICYVSVSHNTTSKETIYKNKDSLVYILANNYPTLYLIPP